MLISISTTIVQDNNLLRLFNDHLRKFYFKIKELFFTRKDTRCDRCALPLRGSQLLFNFEKIFILRFKILSFRVVIQVNLKMPAPKQRMRLQSEKHSKNITTRGNVPKSLVCCLHFLTVMTRRLFLYLNV